MQDKCCSSLRVVLLLQNFVGAGEGAVGIVFSHDIVKQIEAGLPLVLTFPEDGTGYEVGGMAIVEGAEHVDAAQKWYDWALTAEAQALGPVLQSVPGPNGWWC